MSDRIRPPLAEGEHWPEPNRRPWRGPSERGRQLITAAWERLLTAPEWRRPVDPDEDGAA